MLEHGHRHAQSYPLGKVWVEASFVEERVQALEANRALLTQMAVLSIFDKKGMELFQKTLKHMTGEE